MVDLLSWWHGNRSVSIPSYKRAILLLMLIISLQMYFVTQNLPRWNSTDPLDIKFASYYGDNMVLQKAPQHAIIWGFSKSKDILVNVAIDGHFGVKTTSYSLTPNQMNVWKVKLPPMPAGGPHVITAQSLESKIEITNVLFGEVWLCSGQSNMEFTTVMAFNGTNEINGSVNYPDIRVFTVAENSNVKPLYDLKHILEPWSVAAPDKIGDKKWTYFSAICWMYGRRLYEKYRSPIGLISSSKRGTRIEAWSSPDVTKKCGIANSGKHTRNACLWNAMIHPLLNMTINGVIWYQGEANSARAKLYSCLFPAMVADWRAKFHQGSDNETLNIFPFGFVQLAPYHAVGFPFLRWAQTANFGYVPNPLLPNVFMAVAMDLPDPNSPYGSIHPRYKEEIAERLILGLQSLDYNTRINPYQGPFPQHFKVRDKKIEIRYGGEVIHFRNKKGFQISCAKQSICTRGTYAYRAITARINDDHTAVLVSTDICGDSPVCSIRYAWLPSPCPLKKCAVYSRVYNLPAPPFVHTLG